MFTLIEAYTIGVITATYASRGQGMLVVQAGGLTLFIFLGLTLYTCLSKKDFSFMGPMLSIGVCISFIFVYTTLLLFMVSFLYFNVIHYENLTNFR